MGNLLVRTVAYSDGFCLPLPFPSALAYAVAMATQAELDNWYSYHPPEVGQVEVYQAIRAKAFELAELFNEYAPASADSTYAHRSLRNTVMAMNLAIACGS